jgi:hypothetical protein
MKIHIPRKLIGDYKKFIQGTVSTGMETDTTAELINRLELEGRKYVLSLKIKRGD